MIILGVVLLVLGFLLGLGILELIGVILLVLGVVAVLLGSYGHPVGGRRHYW